MRRPSFTGDEELFDALCRVGMIVCACARLEGAIAYFEWQLVAFTWEKQNPQASAAGRQKALRAERASWDRYVQLTHRLSSATKAFEAQPVSSRISKDKELRRLRRHWESLREEARKLGEKRNSIGHTYLSWRDGKVQREIGRPWSEKTVVSKAEDNVLIKDLTELTVEIGKLTTKLGQLLPFADDDQILIVA